MHKKQLKPNIKCFSSRKRFRTRDKHIIQSTITKWWMALQSDTITKQLLNLNKETLKKHLNYLKKAYIYWSPLCSDIPINQNILLRPIGLIHRFRACLLLTIISEWVTKCFKPTIIKLSEFTSKASIWPISSLIRIHFWPKSLSLRCSNCLNRRNQQWKCLSRRSRQQTSIWRSI